MSSPLPLPPPPDNCIFHNRVLLTHHCRAWVIVNSEKMCIFKNCDLFYFDLAGRLLTNDKKTSLLHDEAFALKQIMCALQKFNLTITILDVIHHAVFHLKHDVSEIGMSQSI
jgi:hypothetical protein